MSHTTPQRVRPTASSRSSVSLRISFAQIRKIPPSNIFTILAVCYAKHQIDQKDSDTLWHNTVQTTEQARGTLLPPSTFTACLLAVRATKQARRTSTLWHFYGLLHELPNRPDGFPLALLRLAARATEQAIRVSSGTFTACSIAKHRIGQTDFHPLTLDGSTIRNQLGLGGD